MKVFTIIRKYSCAHIGIHVDNKPSIIAFKSKRVATSFVAMEKSFETRERPMQPLRIENISLDVLRRRCALNALSLTVYDDDCSYNTFDEACTDIDCMQFHFSTLLYGS